MNEMHEAAAGFFAMAASLLFLGFCAAMALGLMYFVMIVAPEASRRCGRSLADRNFMSFALGVPVAGVGLVATVVLGKLLPPAGALAFVLLCLAVIFGLTASSEDLGRRLYYVCGKTGTRAQHLLVGWPIFFLAALVPIVGWFVILPYAVVSGLGSMVMAMIFRAPAEPLKPYRT